MKIALLTVAVFLACIINGLLLFDAFAIGLPVEVPKQASEQVQVKTIPAQTTSIVDKIVLVPYYYLNYWNCKPNEPVRNVIKCIHNRKLNRELSREYYYCTNSH